MPRPLNAAQALLRAHEPQWSLNRSPKALISAEIPRKGRSTRHRIEREGPSRGGVLEGRTAQARTSGWTKHVYHAYPTTRARQGTDLYRGICRGERPEPEISYVTKARDSALDRFRSELCTSNQTLRVLASCWPPVLIQILLPSSFPVYLASPSGSLG